MRKTGPTLVSLLILTKQSGSDLGPRTSDTETALGV